MNRYESIIIVRPTITEEEKKNILEKYKNFFESLSDKKVKVEDMGKRKLAYEIRKNNEGYYFVFDFYAKKEDMCELERKYRIDDDVIKFLTIMQEKELDNSDNIDEETEM